MVFQFKGIATAKNEPDFEETQELCGTAAWMPPEIPEWTARGEVWVIAAISLSLCRLFRRGPLQPQPPHYQGKKWPLSSDARRGIRDLGPGPDYSQPMEDVLRGCLRFSMGKRPLSYELVVMIREAERETLGAKQIPLEPLPPWALKNS